MSRRRWTPTSTRTPVRQRSRRPVTTFALLMCRVHSSSTCGTGWAYVTGGADGAHMHGGLLRGAAYPILRLLAGRYFVVSEGMLQGQPPSKQVLADRRGIGSCRRAHLARRADDAELTRTGATARRAGRGRRSRRHDPAVGQARRLTGFGVETAGHRPDLGGDRSSAGDGLGLAFSDDGGATWNDAALPKEVRLQERRPGPHGRRGW